MSSLQASGKSTLEIKKTRLTDEAKYTVNLEQDGVITDTATFSVFIKGKPNIAFSFTVHLCLPFSLTLCLSLSPFLFLTLFLSPYLFVFLFLSLCLSVPLPPLSFLLHFFYFSQLFSISLSLSISNAFHLWFIGLLFYVCLSHSVYLSFYRHNLTSDSDLVFGYFFSVLCSFQRQINIQ